MSDTVDPRTDCPVLPLGRDADGNTHWLDARGRYCVFTEQELRTRIGIETLFCGDTSWLRRHFPLQMRVIGPNP